MKGGQEGGEEERTMRRARNRRMNRGEDTGGGGGGPGGGGFRQDGQRNRQKEARVSSARFRKWRNGMGVQKSG